MPMILVCFTEVKGKEVFINPQHVTHLTNAHKTTDDTTIYMIGDFEIYVEGGLKKTAKSLCWHPDLEVIEGTT